MSYNGLSNASTINDAFAFFQEKKEQTVYTFLEDGEEKEIHITYGELYESASAIAHSLLQKGKQGDRVLLFYPPGLEFIKAFYGCLLSGLIAVPSYPPRMNRTLERLKAITEDCEASIVLTLCSLKEKVDPFLSSSTIVVCSDLIPFIAESTLLPAIDENDVAFLQYTSGSTGNPKGVMVTHANIMHNQRLIQKAFNQNEHSVIVGWLPFYHDMGLIGNIIHPLFLGARAVLMSPTHFLMKPIRWLKAISKYKATTSGGPNFSYDLCVQKVAEEDRLSLDLSSWTVAFSGAEPVRANTLRNFNQAFHKCGFSKNAFQPCYGMAEATLFISAQCQNSEFLSKIFLLDQLQFGIELSQDSNASVELVSCGRSKEFEFVIVDQNGKIQKDERVGEIWIYGDSVAKGYWQRPELTKECFAAFTVCGKGPFFKTGDLGLTLEDQLYVTGRLKDMIIINGRNFFPQDLELKTVESDESLIFDSCAAFSIEKENTEKLVIICEVDHKKNKDYQEVSSRIRQALFESFELSTDTVVLVRRGSILKTTSGKIQRQACKKAYLDNVLHIISASNEFQRNEQAEPTGFNYKVTETEAHLVSLIQELTKQTVTENDNFLSLGFDSIKISQFAILINEEFNIDLPLDIFFEVQSIKEIAIKIEKETGVCQKSSIPKTEVKQSYELSPLQKGIWLNQQLRKESNVYNLPLCVSLGAMVKLDALEKAFNHLLKKYEILRTCFPIGNEVPVQIVQDFNHKKINQHFFSNKQESDNYIKRLSILPFDLEMAPLWRVEVISVKEENHYLFVLIHHIISDGFSLVQLYRELIKLYEEYSIGNLPSISVPEIQFKDYSEWVNSSLYEEKLAINKSYWLKKLSGELPTIDLPYDSVRKVTSNTGASRELLISPVEYQRLKELAREKGVSLYMLLLSGFLLLMHKLGGQEDIIIGAPAVIREDKALQSVPGPFLNTLMLRFNINKEKGFLSLLKHVKEVVIEGLQNKSYPFNKIVENLQIPINGNTFPISSVFFNGLNFVEDGVEQNNSLIKAFQSNLGLDINFDLNCYVANHEDSLLLRLDYKKELFKDNTIDALLAEYKFIINQVIKNQDQSLFDLITTSEVSNDNKNIFEDAEWYQEEKNIPEILYSQFTKYHAKIAVKTDKKGLTYHELNRLTNQWARYLINKASNNSVVCFCVGHNENLVFSTLSILKAGLTYVALDSEYPVERLKWIIEEVKPKLILTDNQNEILITEICGDKEVQIVNLDNYHTLCSAMTEEDLDIPIDPNSIAYIMYTSGSTGKPKGVMQSHKGVLHFISIYSSALRISSEDKLTGFSSCCYDSFNNDFYGALLNGATYCPLSAKENSGSDEVLNWIKENQISVWHSVPALFRYYASTWFDNGYKLSSLRIVKMTGEAVRVDNFELFKSVTTNKAKFVISLGSTESTLHCINSFSHNEEYSKAIMPVGFPVNRTNVLIMNNSRISGPLTAGEIVIKSDFVSPGYYKRENHNQTTFFTQDEKRYYKTGDIGRILADGRIEWLSRKDGYIKLRGIRVEPAEVEYFVLQHPVISDSVVIVRNSEELICFFVAETHLNVNEIRNLLIKYLPLQSIPEQFIQINTIPLTPNRKTDRIALLNILKEKSLTLPNYFPPTNQLEETIDKIWQEILNMENGISRNESFFHIGGNSIKAMQLTSRLSKEFKVPVSLREVFVNSTISDLANLLLSKKDTQQVKIQPVDEQEDYELSNAQLRIWIQSQLVPYNINGGFRIKGALNNIVLNQAFEKLIARHESLRAIFFETEKGPRQKILSIEAIQFKIDFEDHSRGIEIDEVVNSSSKYEVNTCFDLKKAPLLRVKLLKITKDEHILLLTIHHIISDGWSMEVLGKDVFSLYKSILGGEEFALPKLNLQYKDYAAWQNKQKLNGKLNIHRDYWKKKFLGGIPLVELPLDKPRPKIKTFNGGVYQDVWNNNITEELKSVALKNDTTLFVVLITALKVLLFKATSQPDIIVGTLIAGRDFPDLENQVGLFANTLPLKTRINENLSFEDNLLEVKQTTLEAIHHQSYPIDQLANDLELKRDQSRSMFFDILFILHNTGSVTQGLSDLSGLSISALPRKDTISKFDITFNCTEIKGQLSFFIEYNSDLFEEASIIILFNRYKLLIAELFQNGSIPIKKLELKLPKEKEMEQFLSEVDFDF